AQIKDGNPFKQIRLKPAAKLESLEDVIVLLSVQPLDLTKTESKDASSTAGSVAETAKKEPASTSKTAKP
ncbi:MAG TPA: hypothetical protein VMP12_10855, partial [Candidatus Sulfotelmatobacter sp.]|nr:hypothetical protein [Candidatus Sulfotelmatobacter sp.]